MFCVICLIDGEEIHEYSGFVATKLCETTIDNLKNRQKESFYLMMNENIFCISGRLIQMNVMTTASQGNKNKMFVHT